MTSQFLGRRVWDHKTRMWTFLDGSGGVPDEMRQDVLSACDDKNAMGGNAIPVFYTLFSWKGRLNALDKLK